MLNALKLRKYPELDSLRFISIFLVLSHHLFLDQNIILLAAKKYAWVGVDIFFVLSGFLITSILHSEFLANGTINLKSFWFKRMLRLWPAWILTLIPSFIIVYYFSRQDHELRDNLLNNTWHYLLHFGNYSHGIFGKLHTLFSHFWSLAVEEHFYLFWPIIYLVLLKKRINLNLTLLILFLIPLFFRIFHGFNHTSFAFIKLSTHTRFDEIIAGCLLAVNFKKLEELSIRNEILLTLLMFTFFYIGLVVLDDTTTPYYFSAFNFTFNSFASVLLIIIALNGSKFGLRKILQIPLISKIGILSYNIYLIHFIVITIFFSYLSRYPFTDNQTLMLIIISLMTLPISYVMYLLIDRNIERYKKRNST